MLTRGAVTTSDVATLCTSTEVKPPTSRRREAFYTSVPLGFALRLIPRRFSLILNFPLMSRAGASLRHQQDLSDATFFHDRLSLGCFTEREFLADRDHEFAVAHRLGHEFERLPVEF